LLFYPADEIQPNTLRLPLQTVVIFPAKKSVFQAFVRATHLQNGTKSVRICFGIIFDDGIVVTQK